MISPQSFIETLGAHDITFFTGVPCSYFRGVINYIEERTEEGRTYVLAPNEGSALAIASGAYLGGRLSAVMIQNSGLGNLINPLTSLSVIYDIPALLFVSGRAYGISDEPQHGLMGDRMRALLSSLALEHQELPQEEAGMKRALDQAVRYLKEKKHPYIFIVKKGTFQAYENPEHRRNSFPMKRIDALRVVASSLDADDPIFSTTGKISRELFMVRDRPGNFYMQGSMGHIASVALGTALSKPRKRIVVLDGDGAFLMHMGVASSIGYHAPPNFYHLVLDNESYETTGDQDTASVKTDIAAVAKACGYVSAFTVENEEDLRTALCDLWKQPAPALLRIKINRIPTEGIPRITTRYQAPEITDHFMESLGKSPSRENPVRRVFGEGAFERLPEILSSYSAKTLLVALGEHSFRRSAHFKSLELWLSPYRVLFTSPTPQNPTQEFIQSEIGRLKAEAFDLVLAVGGGSVLDVAKLIAAVIPQKNQSLSDYINGSAAFLKPAVPLIAVPTTAGTGSEVTPFASLETHEKKKITISDAALFPSAAVVDPLLTYSMPGYLTASSGFDAISQAVESFWSVHATPDSRPHALRSLELSIENLPRVIREPHSSSGRSAMALGSCEAGLAIAQTKTTAVHSVSYPITAHFRIAHGHACALTLSSFIRFNAPVLKEGGRPLLSAFKVSSYDEMAIQVDRLMERVGLERKLSSLGVQREGLELIIRDGFRPDRIKNNPREVTKDALRDILNQIY